jgi:hypothetical protein
LEVIMTRNNRLFLLIIVLLVLLAAFNWLDFRLSRQEMVVNSQAERYTIGIDEGNPLPGGQNLDLYVLAPERFDDELAEMLAEELRGNPYTGSVALRDEPIRAATGMVVVVQIEELDTFFWSPIYTRSGADVLVAFASDGEVAWIDEAPVVLQTDNGRQPVVRIRATIEFDDSGYGLISRPGYHSYLAGELATQINTLLEAQLSGAGR